MNLSSSSQVALRRAKELSAFYVAGESRMRVTDQIQKRWFKGENSERVFAIYRARFEEKILLKEEQWHIPNGQEWSSTKRVSEWFFIGNDDVWEITEEEAAGYLPHQAK